MSVIYMHIETYYFSYFSLPNISLPIFLVEPGIQCWNNSIRKPKRVITVNPYASADVIFRDAISSVRHFERNISCVCFPIFISIFISRKRNMFYRTIMLFYVKEIYCILQKYNVILCKRDILYFV